MNCIVIDDDPVIQKQLSAFIIKSDLLEHKGSFKNPTEAFNTIQNDNIDIIFLDIEMPEMSGLEFLDEADNDISIIIISGDRKYALDTFEYYVTDYLVKPVEYKRFLKSVNKAVERKIEKKNLIKSDRFFIKINNSFLRLKAKDILGVRYDNGEKIIVTKSKSYTVLNSVFDANTFCSLENFFKISDSFIVNLNEISEVCDNYLIFKQKDIMENILLETHIANDISNRINNLQA